MTNKQLAAARLAMSAFPALRIEKVGETLTPYRGSTAGASVTVTEWMTKADVIRALTESCAALDG